VRRTTHIAALIVGVLALAPAGLASAAPHVRRAPDPLGAVRDLARQRAGFGSGAAAAALGARADARARELRARASGALLTGSGLGSSWQSLGPAPVTGTPYGGNASGRVDAVAVVPSGPSAGEIFVGTAGGGVWSSTDGGAHWVTHTDQVASGLAIGALAIDPSNPSIVYAGTGEADDCGDCFYGGGVLKSTDGGASWTVENPSGLFTGIDFSALAVDPHNGAHLYAATSAGLYESSDGGASWSHPSGSGDFVNPATAVVLDGAVTPATAYVASENTGIQKSTDGGTNFSTLAGGLPAAANFGSAALAGGTPSGSYPSADRTLYAAVALNGISDPSGGQLSLYKSTDGGATWTLLTTPAYSNQAYAYGVGSADQAAYDNALAVDPANPSHVIAGAISVLETHDGGASFTDLNGQNFFGAAANAFHPDLHAAAFVPSGHVVLGTDGGVFAYDPSTPGRAGVANLNSDLGTAQIYEDLAVGGDGAVLAGMQDNGTALFAGGTAWPDVLAGNGGYSAINPFDGRQQFAEADGYISETTDAWASTDVDITPPGEPDDAANFVPPLTVVANPSTVDDPAVFYGAGDLWLTRDPVDASPSWTQLTAVGTGVSAIAAAPSDPSVLYVGFDDGTLEVSRNASAPVPTFTDITPGVGEWITHIAVSPTNPGHIAVTYSSSNTHSYAIPPMVELGAVALSATPSATFTDITGNLPSGVASNAAVFDGSGLIVATDVGVFATAATGGSATSWSALGAALPNVQVLGLTLDAAGNLYAGTHGRGVWRLASVTPPAPVAASPPTISGRAAQGQTLTEGHATWSGFPTSYRYQWLRCVAGSCAAIPGATGQTYAPNSADLGATLAVQETASGAGGTGLPVTSAATTTVVPAVPAVVRAPTISGSAAVAHTLTEAHATWANAPTGYSYRWESCRGASGPCTAIASATAATYTVRSADVGARIRVLETASNRGGTSAAAASATVGPVVKPAPAVAHPSANQIRSALHAGLSTRHVPRISVLVHHGWTFTFAAPSRGRLTVTWTARPSRHGHPVQIAVLHTTVARAGHVRPKLTLTGSGRRLVASRPTLAVTATSTFAPSGGHAAGIVQTLTLRR
jgi:hypothetical protein